MDPVEEFVLLKVLPSVHLSFRRVLNSRVAALFPLLFLIANVAIFVINATRFFEIASEELIPLRGEVSQHVTIRRQSSLSQHARQHERDANDEDDDYYYEEEHPNAFLETPSLLEAIERAKMEQAMSKYIGQVPALSPGKVLIANPSEDAFLTESGEETDFARSVVILTRHGGKLPSQGFIVNAKLPEEEAEQARRMLHLYGHSEVVLSQLSVEESDRFTHAIRDPNRLWLGFGGPVRDDGENWMHIHNCTGVASATTLAKGVAYAGDILNILLDHRCFIKLLYGEALWAPGQLDKEVLNGTWLVREARASLLFHPSQDKEVIWAGLLDEEESRGGD